VDAVPSTFLLNNAAANVVSDVMYETAFTGFRASAVTTLTHAYYRVYFPGHAPTPLAGFGGYYSSASTPVYLKAP